MSAIGAAMQKLVNIGFSVIKHQKNLSITIGIIAYCDRLIEMASDTGRLLTVLIKLQM
jgi:hypothetical protein